MNSEQRKIAQVVLTGIGTYSALSAPYRISQADQDIDDAESFAVVLIRTMIQIRPIFGLTDIG